MVESGYSGVFFFFFLWIVWRILGMCGFGIVGCGVCFFNIVKCRFECFWA